MPQPARPWARVAGVIGVGVMIWTATFFIPLLMKTQANRGAGLSGEEITRFTLQFVNWGLLRTAVAIGRLAGRPACADPRVAMRLDRSSRPAVRSQPGTGSGT